VEEIEYSIQLHVHLFLFFTVNQNLLLLFFHIELCSCGSRHKLLFELITHPTVLSKHIYCAHYFVPIASPQFTMSQFQVQIGNQGLQRRTTTSGMQSLGNSPGHYSLAASARGTGGLASHRPGVTHVDTPMTASAIR
jgi:hypothetical protein